MLNLSLSNFFMHCRSLKSKGGPRYSRFPNFPGTKHPRIARETCIVILIFQWPFCRRRRATWSPPSWLGWAMLTPEVRRPFFITKPRGRWCQREGRRHSGTTSIGKAIEIREHTTEAAPSSRERNGFSTSGSSTSIRFKHFHVDCTLKLDHFTYEVIFFLFLQQSSFLEQNSDQITNLSRKRFDCVGRWGRIEMDWYRFYKVLNFWSFFSFLLETKK